MKFNNTKKTTHMKTMLAIIAATLAAAGSANTPVSAYSSATTLDTRTQGFAILNAPAQVETRGLTFDISDEIELNTMKVVPTIVIIR